MYKYIIKCIDIFICKYMFAYIMSFFYSRPFARQAADWSITCLLVPMNPVSALGNNHGMFITKQKKPGNIFLWMKIWVIVYMELLVLTHLEMFRPTPSWCSVVLSCCVNAPTSLHTGTTHGQYVDWSTDSRNALPKWVFENGVYPGIPSGISIGGLW